MKLRLGSRGSALALAQARWTAGRLEAAGHEVELRVLTTSGDRFSAADQPPPEAPSGAPDFNKALFVKEIEEALLAHTIDLAVHSAKDLPARLPEGLLIAAYPEREDAGDRLVASHPFKDLPPGSKIGTSALRRSCQLRALRPDLEYVPLRGNVDTRLRKLEAGEVDGVVLAAAGLSRLGKGELGEPLDLVAAPGQGALALEARADDASVRSALAPLDDPRCRAEVEAERALLAAVGGGCRTPLGARAELDGAWMRLSVFWSDPEGRRPARLSGRSKTEPAKLAESIAGLAERLRELSAA